MCPRCWRRSVVVSPVVAWSKAKNVTIERNQRKKIGCGCDVSVCISEMGKVCACVYSRKVTSHPPRTYIYVHWLQCCYPAAAVAVDVGGASSSASEPNSLLHLSYRFTSIPNVAASTSHLLLLPLLLHAYRNLFRSHN